MKCKNHESIYLAKNGQNILDFQIKFSKLFSVSIKMKRQFVSKMQRFDWQLMTHFVADAECAMTQNDDVIQSEKFVFAVQNGMSNGNKGCRSGQRAGKGRLLRAKWRECFLFCVRTLAE